MPKANPADYPYTQNRELSWLRFNERVLQQAQDPSNPLFEQLKFLSIFTSNLDEFFMIRVGSLFDLSLLKKVHIDNKSGMTPAQQLKAIYAAVVPLYQKRDEIFLQLEAQLQMQHITRVDMQRLTPAQRRFMDAYFRQSLLPLLSPQVVDACHPFPHLPSKMLTVAAVLRANKKDKEKENEIFALIPVPRALERIVVLPGEEQLSYVLLEDVLLHYVGKVFDRYHVVDKAVICVTRNADINPDDESYELEEDYRQRMKQVLKKRAQLACVRLEIQNDFCPKGRNWLINRLNIGKEQVFFSKTPLSTKYLYSLIDMASPAQKRQLSYPAFAPQPSPMVHAGDMFKQILSHDILLSYPYESMEPFLRLVKQAAEDPNVLSIKITIYRLANPSRLVDLLCLAAENGKEVVALLELRARFDESNNINWSEQLENAGCKVLYGTQNFKVHSKLCLITRRYKNRLQYFTHIGTGNFNEKTCKLYTDLSLLTADKQIGEDTVAFFQNMAIANLAGEYHTLLVAPHSLKPRLIELIDQQIQRAKEGRPAYILLKLNSITDRDLIDKLSQASQAGVPVDLIVRGICCLLPKVPFYTEHIRVISVVGRFLEHSRVYCFLLDQGYQMYISSADWMTRNTSRRVEVACPVNDPSLQSRILHNLQTMLSDTKKARELLPNGTYTPIAPSQGKAISCQEVFMQQALHPPALSKSSAQNVGSFFSRLFRR